MKSAGHVAFNIFMWKMFMYLYIYLCMRQNNQCLHSNFKKNRVIAVGYYRPVMQCPIAFLFIVVWSWIRLLVTPPPVHNCFSRVLLHLLCFALLLMAVLGAGRGPLNFHGTPCTPGGEPPTPLPIPLPPYHPPPFGCDLLPPPRRAAVFERDGRCSCQMENTLLFISSSPPLALSLSLTAGLIFWR